MSRSETRSGAPRPSARQATRDGADRRRPAALRRARLRRASAPRRSSAPPGVTRGALYHHFGGKASCFEAVYEQIEAESTERIARVVLGSELHSPLAAMKAGVEVFLDECAEPEAAADRPPRRARGPRLGPLARDRRRHGLGLIEASLQAAIEAGEIRPLPVRAAGPPADGRPRRGGDAGRPRRATRAARAEVTEVLVALLDSSRRG